MVVLRCSDELYTVDRVAAPNTRAGSPDGRRGCKREPVNVSLIHVFDIVPARIVGYQCLLRVAVRRLGSYTLAHRFGQALTPIPDNPRS